MKIPLQRSREDGSSYVSGMEGRGPHFPSSYFVLDFISEGFPGCGHSVIYVVLEKRRGNSARLAIDSNGVCVGQQRLENTLAIAGQLISVLDGDLVIRKSRFGGWRFEVEFPVHP